MVNWFLIALIAPLAHAAVNHIDKHLISRYLRGSAVGSLVLFSALFAIVVLPIVAWWQPTVFLISRIDALVLIINGFLLVGAYICYFHALKRDEASFIVPLFQLIPVFGFIIGYFVLGETLYPRQLMGSIVIILGAVLLSFELSKPDTSFKKETFVLMIGSSFLFALNAILFKFVAENQQRFWSSFFWESLGKVICGVLIFLLVDSYRQQFLAVLKFNRKGILALNSFNETIGLVGEGAFTFATLLAPVAIVQVVGGFQPMFVFLYGVVLTLLFPRFVKESIAKRDLLQKIVGIAIIIGGTTLLSL